MMIRSFAHSRMAGVTSMPSPVRSMIWDGLSALVTCVVGMEREKEREFERDREKVSERGSLS